MNSHVVSYIVYLFKWNYNISVHKFLLHVYLFVYPYIFDIFSSLFYFSFFLTWASVLIESSLYFFYYWLKKSLFYISILNFHTFKINVKFWIWGFKLNKLLFLLQKYQHNMSIWCQKRVKHVDMMLEKGQTCQYDVRKGSNMSIWCQKMVKHVNMMSEKGQTCQYDVRKRSNMSIWCRKRVKHVNMISEKGQIYTSAKQQNSFTLMSTISAASTATSVPVPIAIPTSAWARAGESLTPSPTMATLIPSFWICLTFFTLWDGNTSANTRWIPTWVNKRLSLIILVFTTLLQRTPTFSMSESVWVLISIWYFDFTYTFV